MKICDIVPFHYEKNCGGIETYIAEKIRFMESRPDVEHVVIINSKEKGMYKKGNLTVYTDNIIFGNTLIDIIERENPDVLETSMIDALVICPLLKYNKKKQLPLTGYLHSDEPVKYSDLYCRNKLTRIFKGVVKNRLEHHIRKMCNQFDRTFVASDVILNAAEDYQIANAIKIPLGVDTQEFNPDYRSKRFRKRLGVRNDELLLVYHGRFAPEKNIDVLIDMMGYLPKEVKARLLLVGDGISAEHLKEKAKGNSSIIFHAKTKDKKVMAKILASSDIYLTACGIETFGLSIVEAQSSGLPVVGVCGGALIERVPQNTGLLGKMGDPKEMADNIVKLLAYGHDLAGQNARNHILENYSWEKTFTRMLSLYKELIRDHKESKTRVVLEKILESPDGTVSMEGIWQPIISTR